MNDTVLDHNEQVIVGGGEMGELIRRMDWSKTALGPIEKWPQSLRTSVSLCLSSTFPILIAWGPEKIQLYNDSYRPICGAKHPESMGMNFRVCWETALEVVGDAFTRTEEYGEGTYINDQRMFLDRYGYLEEAFMTFSFAPIRDESGGVGGIFHPITETTAKILSGRRTQVLRELGAALGKAKSIQEISRVTVDKYDDYHLDIPFLLFYQFDHPSGSAHLLANTGLPGFEGMSPSPVDLSSGPIWPLEDCMTKGGTIQVDNLEDRFGTFESGPYPEAPRSALLLPLRISGQSEVFGCLIAGVSARRALDEEYSNFYDQLTTTYNTAISSVYAYEQEQKRAEALAEIDRSKTAFFGNVSHEFRTPLTLMLGPLEDMLSSGHIPEEVQVSLTVVRRNAQRLLKLVNNLLDYSRVEAGRTQAAYEKVALGEFTEDLSSSFRSIIEKSGMQFLVSCEPLSQDVYVDRQMWEKIVLNLLSNAFKYTLEGSIAVSVSQEAGYAVLKVKDTGIGIPEKELPHMFERFHRVENAGGRTHEGTGIGLSLVHELVSLHGGTVSLSSEEGIGSVFTVKIPFGCLHLPADKVRTDEDGVNFLTIKDAFLEEAISLLPQEISERNENRSESGDTAALSVTFLEDSESKILIVDDNADMRAYLQRLIAPYFKVFTATNGADALAQIPKVQPDLILSDIMMPVMDGKTMLDTLRNDVGTMRLPVIFLSARAGEEARVDGLEAGADDYLVKPFSAIELLTKIRAQIRVTKERSHAEKQLRRLVVNAPVAIALYRGPQHVIEIANDRMISYWCKSADDIIGRPLFDVLPGLRAQGIDAIMNEVYHTGHQFVYSKLPIILERYGKQEITYINLTIEALHEPDGRITGLMAAAADVTDLVLTHHELEKASDTLSLALDAANMGTWRTDWGKDNLMLSDTAKMIHGVPLELDPSFTATMALVIPEHRDRLYEVIRWTAENKERFDEEYQILPMDGGKRRWIHSTGKAEMDEQGQVVSVIGTLRDITEEKEDEQRKTDFISMVSHEMKTPLTSISAFTQLLQGHAKRQADPYAEDKLHRIYTQVKKMSGLITGFLDVSRLNESGKIHLNYTTFQLDILINEVLEDLRETVSSHELIFEEKSAQMLTADRDKIGSVLSNLVTNAIKYSQGKQRVEIRCDVSGDRVVLSVHDQGMGIREDDQERLFERYYRADNLHMKNIGGFGIGLYMCAEIVKRHHGEIWVESVYGEGAVFSVRLPLHVS